MITSISNNRIKTLIQLSQKSKVRNELGAFLIEGERLFCDSPDKYIKEVYITNDFSQKANKSSKQKLDKLKMRGVDIEYVSDEVMKKISDTKTPQGVCAIAKKPNLDRDDFYKKLDASSLLLILENLQDPGNMGTILRVSEAAGVSGIILSNGCVDIYNPKVVRATMGSIFRVPILFSDNLKRDIGQCKNKKIKLYAAHLKGQKSYEEFDLTKGSAFLIGNEGNGLTDETASLADFYVKIPMLGQIESLNAAMAAGILVYDAARQRRS